MEKTEVKVMQKILNANDRIAEELRAYLNEKDILFVNLMSSPGSGKTTLIEKTAETIDKNIGVIEGDIQTTLDAERIANLGVKTYQINTGPFGGDCHLEAGWVKSAIDEMGLDDVDLLFVENIGNLVCPAEFDVGAHANVVVLSLTEGEDKPLKYPLAFRVSDVCVLSKTDLLPYLDISLESLKSNITQINPDIKIIELSSKTGEGVDQWLDYLKR
jgi:hydrogenase nickel incorporation protein HypB